MKRSRRSERSQALVEFALVSPVLLLLTFGIIDFGRAMYFYVTIGNSAREVARYAAASSLPLPTFANGFVVASVHSPGVILSAPCPSGPVTGVPPANTGWVYITEPSPPALVESSPSPNAPGGDAPGPAAGVCSAVNPAVGQAALEVTITYNFTPVTPLVSQVIGNRVVLTVHTYFTTEY